MDMGNPTKLPTRREVPHKGVATKERIPKEKKSTDARAPTEKKIPKGKMPDEMPKEERQCRKRAWGIAMPLPVDILRRRRENSTGGQRCDEMSTHSISGSAKLTGDTPTDPGE